MRSGLISALLIGTLAGSPAVAQVAPDTVVEETGAELLAALDGRREELSADREQLYAVIEKILWPRLDRRYTARLVLGKHWRNASEAQQDRFVEGLIGMLMRSYADGLLEFTPDRMLIEPFRGDASKPRVTVRTKVQLADGTKIPVYYKLRRSEAGWRVYDVLIEGISYVKNFRTEINAEITVKGLEAAIQRLEKRAAVKPSVAAGG